MAEGGTLTFSDPEGYAAAFGDVRINLTISGAGDFKARLTRLKWKDLQVHWCCESLPRIAFVSLPPDQIFLSFAAGTASPAVGGLDLRNGDMVLHRRGELLHQWSEGVCRWGLISLSSDQLAACGTALNGQPIAWPPVSAMLRPSREETLRFHNLLGQACQLVEGRQKLIDHPEIARALEQRLLHAVVHFLTGYQANGSLRTRDHHAAVMVRFEEIVSKRLDQRLSIPALCTEIGVAERTLRMCCAKFLGVSPSRYLLLRRLNKARSALERADPLTATVAEIARNHQFLELGRFAVTYRATFGESPSATLQRNSLARGRIAESA